MGVRRGSRLVSLPSMLNKEGDRKDYPLVAICGNGAHTFHISNGRRSVKAVRRSSSLNQLA